jgi:hypothetical protein
MILLLVVACLSVSVAAVVMAGLLPARGLVSYLLSVALLAYATVVAAVGIAGLVFRSFAPELLTALAVAAALIALGLAAALPEKRRSWPGRARVASAALRHSLSDLPVALGAILVVATIAWRVFLALRLPLVDYDGWSYHLVFVDVWLEHNALTLVPQRIWTQGDPAAMELVLTWLAAFSRSDALTGLASVLPIPVAITAVTGLARCLGATRRTALLAGLVFGMTPALVALAGTSYVDGASVAFVAASWWLGVRIIRGERDPATAMLLGIAGGLALGTKGTNLLLVSPILAGAGVALLAGLVGRRRGDAPAVIRRLVVLGVPILVFGASWYAKNLIVHANPLYPFAVGPFAGPTSFTQFAFVPPQLEGMGAVHKLATSWLADWHVTRYAYNVRPGGLGRAWPAVIALAIVGLALLVKRRRLVPLALVVLPAAVTLAVMPMQWYARYTLFAPALATALAAVALTALAPRLRTAAGLVLVGVAAVSLTFANIHPNIDVRPAIARPPSRVTAGQYLRYVFTVSDARRANVSLRHDCAAFATIPPGSIVAPGGFNLLHGVVGPDLDRILGEPLPPVADAASLAAAVRADGATWLVTASGGDLDAIAESAPGWFVPEGDICQGARLWRLAAGS